MLTFKQTDNEFVAIHKEDQMIGAITLREHKYTVEFNSRAVLTYHEIAEVTTRIGKLQNAHMKEMRAKEQARPGKVIHL